MLFFELAWLVIELYSLLLVLLLLILDFADWYSMTSTVEPIFTTLDALFELLLESIIAVKSSSVSDDLGVSFQDMTVAPKMAAMMPPT